MWGNWLVVTLGGVGVLLVLLAATVLASPLLAILLAVVVIALSIPVMSRLRSGSEGGGGVEGGSGGAPASGEGATVGGEAIPAAHRARERTSGRISKGIWGERREA